MSSERSRTEKQFINTLRQLLANERKDQQKKVETRNQEKKDFEASAAAKKRAEQQKAEADYKKQQSIKATAKMGASDKTTQNMASDIKNITNDFIVNLRDMMNPSNLSKIASGQAYIPKDQRIKIENDMMTKANEVKSALNSALPKIAASIAEGFQGGRSSQPDVTINQTDAQTSPNTATETDTLEYTYKPGDTFGRVIMNMGLSDGRNLWGPNGDVAYYTKQLNDQGIYGNIPIGKTIRLRRRPKV